MSKMTLIALGGAGVNVVDNIYGELNGLGDEFAKLEVHTLDTTDSNIAACKNNLRNTFTKLTSNMDGRGGERKDIAASKALEEATGQWLKEANLSNGKDSYYIIIFSGSGATGSVAGIHLVTQMLAAGYTIIVAMVIATNDVLRLNNSYKTLAGLNAKAKGVAVPVILFSNTIDGVTNKNTENIVNDHISSTINALMGMVSGNIKNIDMQDCINFLHPTKFTTFDAPAGLYELILSGGDIEDKDAKLSLTLTTETAEPHDTKIMLKSSKIGFLPESMAGSDIYNAGVVHLLMLSNTIQRSIKVMGEELAVHEANTISLEDTGVNIEDDEMFL